MYKIQDIHHIITVNRKQVKIYSVENTGNHINYKLTFQKMLIYIIVQERVDRV